MTLTAAQVKEARKLLGWTLVKLESKTGVRSIVIAGFEAGKSRPSVLQLTIIRRVIESAGIEFIAENGGGAGVRLRNPP